MVYIAHPLSGDWEGNIAAARAYVAAAIHRGWVPCAPYIMTDGILVEPLDRELGMALDLAYLARCDQFWACGPTVSPGMAIEWDEAVRLGLVVARILTPESTPAYQGS